MRLLYDGVYVIFFVLFLLAILLHVLGFTDLVIPIISSNSSYTLELIYDKLYGVKLKAAKTG